MTFPAFLFGFLLAALYGAAFHFWRAELMKKLPLLLLFSEVGFWAGHFLAASLGWTFIQIGPLNAGLGTLGSAVFLFVGDWLSQVEINPRKS
jgi:hypothetical protein